MKSNIPVPNAEKNPLAERLISRWHETAMTTTAPARGNAGGLSSRVARTNALVQRLTEQRATAGVWKARATSKQEAIEQFTDGLVQRFPDMGAKYAVHSSEENSGATPEMVYTREPNGAPETASEAENAPEVEAPEAFDVNQLPSIPNEIWARHKTAAQQRADVLPQTSTPPASGATPRPVQRKPADSRLVRPRSKVDYIGSKPPVGATGAPPVQMAGAPKAEQATPLPSPSLDAAPTSEQSGIKESTPLEEPKWRTRPRAGFQSLPTHNSEGNGGQTTVPYTPIQMRSAGESSALHTASEVSAPEETGDHSARPTCSADVTEGGASDVAR